MCNRLETEESHFKSISIFSIAEVSNVHHCWRSFVKMNLIWLIRDGSLLLNESKEWSQGDSSQAAYLPPGLPLFILFSANPLLLGSLSATLLLEDQNTKRQCFFFFFFFTMCRQEADALVTWFVSTYLGLGAFDEVLQFFLWERWAPPPPSSCTQSERRSATAAHKGLCFDVSSGCPVRGREETDFTDLQDQCCCFSTHMY